MPQPLHSDSLDIEGHRGPPANWGDPRLPGRFWDKVSPCPMSGCWLWLAGWNAFGYGAFNVVVDGRYRACTAHRLAYQTLVGAIPVGLVLDHLCRVRCCCNPAHLEAVTQRVNVHRGVGVAALNVTKTSCPAGHEYAAAGVYVYQNGKRKCRACRRRQSAEQRARESGGAK